tara:strand:- start:261 stop:515 length:255 start_codon:yes stop_codon:yes gene_type:complete
MSDTHTTRIANQLLRASLSAFEAQRQEALATLDIYLHQGAGVADHSQIVSEVNAAARRLAEAEEVIASLQRNLLTTPEDEEDGE